MRSSVMWATHDVTRPWRDLPCIGYRVPDKEGVLREPGNSWNGERLAAATQISTDDLILYPSSSPVSYRSRVVIS